jgi:DMSO/TMAO reductase YedYZ molybdopterin-dependent catalytic subunit
MGKRPIILRLILLSLYRPSKRKEGGEHMESLRIEGAVAESREFRFEDLAALPHQVPDVGLVVPGREGGGVRLQSILDTVIPAATAHYVTLKSSDGKFSASVPLTAVGEAIVAYRLGDEPLPSEKGGPFRFLIPNIEECAIGGVDACANVKFLARMELSQQPGVDNRPISKTTHEEHHTKEGHAHLKHD